MSFSKKDAIQRLFLCPGIGRYVVRSQGWRYDECPGMDGISQGARKAVRICPWMAVRLCLLYFFISFVYIPQALAGPGCSSGQFDETSKIRYIYDGDTLRLNDGRKIRLIGINTPELAHDGKPAEAFAFEAKNTLKSLFKNDKSIALVYGKEKKFTTPAPSLPTIITTAASSLPVAFLGVISP